jgi:hypothetical protein
VRIFPDRLLSAVSSRLRPWAIASLDVRLDFVQLAIDDRFILAALEPEHGNLGSDRSVTDRCSHEDSVVSGFDLDRAADWFL